ncbi:flagellar associated protein, partial [Monoraphidium neglectum]
MSPVCRDDALGEAGAGAGLPQDQFAVRALYAAGQLVAQQASALKGRALVDATLEARDGARAHLLASQGAVCQALEKAGDAAPPEWRVRQLMALAMCQAECGRADEAGRVLGRAQDLANRCGLESRQEVARLSMHITCTAAKATPAGKPGPGGKGAPAASVPPPLAKAPAPGASAGATTAAAAPAANAAAAGRKGGKGGPAAAAAAAAAESAAAAVHVTQAEKDSAVASFQWVMSSRPDVTVAAQQLKDAWARVDPRPQGTTRGVNLGVVARIAWAAACCGAAPLAEACAARASAAPDLGPRAWADLARAALALAAARAPEGVAPPTDKASDPVPVRRAADAHAAVLEALEDVLGAFLRLRDAEGIHYASKLAWNAGLPLLQPNTRRRVKRCFASAARALEAVASPLGRLRAQLHLELGKCEADDDALVKAAKEVHQALALDYAAAAEERAQQLAPLDRAFRVRAGFESGGLEDAALAALERARGSDSPALRAEYLSKAIAQLSSLPQLAPPDASVPPAERAPAQVTARTRASIWAEVVRVAWAARLEAVVLDAAPFVLAARWAPEVDRRMTALQAEIAALEVEAKLQAEVVPPADPSAGKVDVEDGIRVPPTTAEQLQRRVADGILESMRAAAEAQEPWRLANSAALAWNAYLPLLQRRRHAEALPVLLPALQLLLQPAAAAGPGPPPPPGGSSGAQQQQQQQQPAAGAGAAQPAGGQPAQAAGRRWELAAKLAEAVANGAEHVALLQMLRPAPPAPAASETSRASSPAPRPGSALAAVAAAVVAAAGGGDGGARQLAFRQGLTPWFCDLQQARHKAAAAGPEGLKRLASPDQPKALSVLMSSAAATCQEALARGAAAGAPQPQSLLRAFARLQQLWAAAGAADAAPAGPAAAAAASAAAAAAAAGGGGAAPAPLLLPPGAPPALELSAKVLSAIEALTASPAPADAAGQAKTEQASPAACAVRAAMTQVSQLPAADAELWARLSRAAAAQRCWPHARDCARGALPPELRAPGALEALGAAAAAPPPPHVARETWFWLAVAEMQHGQ